MSSTRPRGPMVSIGVKLALAYLVPTALLWGVLSIFTTRAASSELDDELGRRLSSLAANAALQVRGRYLMELEPGDESKRPYENTFRKLELMRATSGASRIYVFKPDLTALCDTGQSPIGARLYQLELDRTEIDRMFAEHVAVSSTLFRGSDGRLYKAGYATVAASEDDATVVAGLAIEAPAEYFTRLEALQGRLKGYAALALALYVLISVLAATLLVRPLRRLTAAAARIGQGELDTPVPVSGHDEITFLARTLDEMRAALRARNERLQMMLAGIAHEVRNPLGGIELYAGILREESKDPEALAHIAKIEREVGHLKTVVGDFLDYARRPRPELKPTPLAPLLSELTDLCRADAAAGQVELTLTLPDALAAHADAGQLRRALLNLIKNAIQATPTGGRVEITAARAGAGQLRIAVSDTGKGIAADSVDKIFTPFFTTKEKGTGLGLAFVREIVTDHGGTLSVDSEVGRGTTFTLLIPEAGA